MKMIAFLLFFSIGAQASQSVEGTWIKKKTYRNEWGKKISDVITLEIFANYCMAFSEVYEEEMPITGGKLDCYLKNNFIKISSWGVDIAKGQMNIKNNYLILSYYNRAYNRRSNVEKYFFRKKTE